MRNLKIFFLNLFNSSRRELIQNKSEVKPLTEKRKISERQNTKYSIIKKHLIENETIDSWTAINLYGVTRLSAIIFKLKDRGYNIESINNSSFDRNNDICNFTTYKLHK